MLNHSQNKIVQKCHVEFRHEISVNDFGSIQCQRHSVFNIFVTTGANFTKIRLRI